MAIYQCPACGGEFEPKQKKRGRCPHCEVKLKSVRHRKEEGSGFYYEYLIADESDPNLAVLKEKKGAVKIDWDERQYGRRITDISEQPQIFIEEEGEVNGQMRTGARYNVVFTNRVHLGWIYCPGCMRKLFQNTTLQSGAFNHEHKCRNGQCKSTVVVICRIWSATVPLQR